MPGMSADTDSLRKRKRSRNSVDRPRKKISTLIQSRTETNLPLKIQLLEEQTLDSRLHYNNIIKLIGYARHQDGHAQRCRLATVALCRIFSMFLSTGTMKKSEGSTEQEVVIAKWLRERYQEYQDMLLHSLSSSTTSYNEKRVSLKLLMQLVKEEIMAPESKNGSTWRRGLFLKLLCALVKSRSDSQIITDFITQYLEHYEDARFYTFLALSKSIPSSDVIADIDTWICLLAGIQKNREGHAMKFYALPQNKTENEISSLRAHSRAAQEAWMKLLKINLDKPQRKTLLGLVSHHIAPWFLRIDLLMDFLVDSFNLGGSMSLVALSGLFYLIQKRNLDYPQFYTKLYGLLDAQILHSKHRSRFLRLLDTFLASTHLPAVLVASFIKRLSRLCLYSPPSGIVIIVPLIYNLLKEHPACTFMIHRETPELERKMRMKDEGLEDPFDMEEKNPMASRAIDSSLWEIETLQSHYHPNVATIAKMISEQFTKQGYNLEDFLDHSYGSILDAELSKDPKNIPVVEYEIPKKIFAKDGSEIGHLDALLMSVWDFN